MSEWKEYRLGEVCIYNTERIPLNLLNEENYISTENMLPNIGGVTISSNLPTSGNAVHFYNGDILISNIRPYFKKIWYANKEGGCSADVLCIRANKDIDKQYLYYLLSQQDFFDYVMAGAKGCKMPRGDKQHIMNWEISLPSLPTQQKIANILSSLDDKIEVNRSINEQLEELAQALFKSWFVDFEPFKDGEFVDSELVKLGGVINTTSGGTPSRKHMEYYGGNHGWVKSKELNGTFIIATEETITDDAIAKSSAKLLPEKSILIAMYGATVGQYAILSKPMTCNQAVCALLPNDDYPYTFLFMFAKNKKDELINKAVGSAQQNISQILIKDLDVSNDTKKIKEFHRIVKPAFEGILKNQQEILHLTTLRDTLLPKLMSWEMDVYERGLERTYEDLRGVLERMT